jgi:hypothetical protein
LIHHFFHIFEILRDKKFFFQFNGQQFVDQE